MNEEKDLFPKEDEDTAEKREDTAPEEEPHYEGGERRVKSAGTSMGTAALLVSIISLFCCGLPFGLAGIVMALIARKRNGAFTAEIVIALILSLIGFAAALVSVIYFATFFNEIRQALEAGGLV